MIQVTHPGEKWINSLQWSKPISKSHLPTQMHWGTKVLTQAYQRTSSNTARSFVFRFLPEGNIDQIDLSFHLGQGMHHSLEDHDRILHFKRFFVGLPLGFLLTTYQGRWLKEHLTAVFIGLSCCSCIWKGEWGGGYCIIKIVNLQILWRTEYIIQKISSCTTV